MEAVKHKMVNRPAPESQAAGHPIALRIPPGVQASMGVAAAHDPAEKEAEATARRIVGMPGPAGKTKRNDRQLQRRADTAEEKAIPASPATTEEIRQSLSSGNPLPGNVKSFMESRFNADFSRVRIHNDSRSSKLNQQLSSQAFTYGNHIFFGQDKFRPESTDGKELIAHELTHTIQQRAVIQKKSLPGINQFRPSMVQRLGISDALDYFADKANHIPGFRMFTIILGVNPVNMSSVDRSAANVFRAVIEFIPGGGLITQALDNHGITERVANWVAQQISSLGMVGSSIRQAINRFLDSLSWTDIFHLGDVWRRAVRIFTEPIDRIIQFARNLLSGIIEMIKQAILLPLARLAEGTRAYPLLKAVLGRDPVTGEAVPQTAETIIGGFMTLIGQEEIWANIQRANAIPRAWAWFRGAMSALLGFVGQIPQLVIAAFRSLELMDIVLVPRAFIKVGRVFAGFVGQFISWAGTTIWNLLEIIFDVVAPSVMPYLRRARSAFQSILRNPVGFVGNLVRAAIQGFRQFATNFLTHLRNSLIQWLTGALPGVYIPQALNLREIIRFVLSVLGLTWQHVRTKLVRAVGETSVRALVTGFEFVRILVTQGPAAAWDKIVETIQNLQQMVIDGVMEFVRSRIIQAAVTRLLSMLSPAGAFIQAIIAIYNTVMFFIERLRQIAQVAASFIDSIAAIAGGAIAAAAQRVESTMAGLLTLVISFLARIAGLGRVSDAVMNIIRRVREPIDRAIDRVVQWIVAQARRLGRFVAQAGVPNDPNERLRLAVQHATTASKRLGGRVTRSLLAPVLNAIRIRYGLSSLTAMEKSGTWWVKASINPDLEHNMGIPVEGAATAAPGTADENKQRVITRKTGSLAGDTVGLEMTIDWLGPGQPVGTPPESGVQDTLMNLLITNPSESSERKYIRGHLLNEHLGGRGNAENLFPITGNANSQHLHSTEKKVKGWVEQAKNKVPKRWVYYEVKVRDVDYKLDLKKPKSYENYVNSSLACRAILKDANGKKEDEFSTTIPSVFKTKGKAENLSA